MKGWESGGLGTRERVELKSRVQKREATFYGTYLEVEVEIEIKQPPQRLIQLGQFDFHFDLHFHVLDPYFSF